MIFKKLGELSFFCQNVRGLRAKSTSLLNLYCCIADFIILTETELNDSIDNALLFPSYFSVNRCDRSSVNSQFSRLDGVLIAINNNNNNLTCSEIDMSVSSLSEMETHFGGG